MANVIAEAGRKPAQSEARVKNPENEQIITLKKSIRERLRKWEISSAVLGSTVTHWQAIQKGKLKSRFEKYALISDIYRITKGI